MRALYCNQNHLNVFAIQKILRKRAKKELAQEYIIITDGTEIRFQDSGNSVCFLLCKINAENE